MQKQVAAIFEQLPAPLLQGASTPIQELGCLYLNLSEVLGQKQLSPADLTQLLALLLSNQLTLNQLTSTAEEQDQPAQQQTATGDAGVAPPPPAPTIAAKLAHPGILPWHTLVLSSQPLGTDGLLQTFRRLCNPQRLRSLVAAYCDINGSFIGEQLFTEWPAAINSLDRWGL